MSSSSGQYLIYADGACKGNPGPGGWGAIIIAPDGSRQEMNGGDPATTNNRMEMTAAIEALRRVERGAQVVLRTDSQYVVNTMTRNWKRNANRDLWEQLDVESELRDVRFEWVRGHAGDELNERADELAVMGARGRIVSAAAGAHRDGAAAPAAHPRGGVTAQRRAELASAAKAILRQGETVRKCFGCGREFIAASDDDFFCSVVECQVKARK